MVNGCAPRDSHYPGFRAPARAPPYVPVPRTRIQPWGKIPSFRCWKCSSLPSSRMQPTRHGMIGLAPIAGPNIWPVSGRHIDEAPRVALVPPSPPLRIGPCQHLLFPGRRPPGRRLDRWDHGDMIPTHEGWTQLRIVYGSSTTVWRSSHWGAQQDQEKPPLGRARTWERRSKHSRAR